MIANFLNNEEITKTFEVSLSFRNSEEYLAGLVLREEMGAKYHRYPLELKDAASFYKKMKIIFSNRLYHWPLRVTQFFLRYIYVVMNTRMLIKLFKEIQPDILHVNNGGYPGAYSCMAAVFAAGFCGINNIVYVVNNLAEGYKSPKRWLDFFLDRIVVKKVNYFVTGSVYAREQLARVLKRGRNRYYNIPNYIKERTIVETHEQVRDRLGIDIEECAVGMVGVFEKRKGHEVLFEAVDHLRKNKCREVPRVFIEGKGGIEEELKRCVESLDLGKNIVFVGREKNIFDFINAIDILILPSIGGEDYPNIILEGMSLGKAIIGSKIAGIPEQILNMKTGIIVEPGDAKGLADAVWKLYEDKSLINELGSNALDYFRENYDEKIITNKYMSLYNNLTG